MAVAVIVVVVVLRRKFVVRERAAGRRVQGCLTRLHALVWSQHVQLACATNLHRTSTKHELRIPREIHKISIINI
jgi:hypothetical protein